MAEVETYNCLHWSMGGTSLAVDQLESGLAFMDHRPKSRGLTCRYLERSGVELLLDSLSSYTDRMGVRNEMPSNLSARSIKMAPSCSILAFENFSVLPVVASKTSRKRVKLVVLSP